MRQINSVLEGAGSVVQLLMRSLSYVGTLPRQWARFIEQCYMIGYTTLPIVAILSFFIGTVLALEAGYAMQGFGAKEFIGSLVGLSMARELGPMMTAVLLAGRVGSAITAELASMKVYQEIDALVTMNIPAGEDPRPAAAGRRARDDAGPDRHRQHRRLVRRVGRRPLRELGRDQPGGVLRGAAPLHEVQGRHERHGEGGGLRLRRRPRVLRHRAQHARGPARDRRAVTRGVVVSLILILVLDYFVTKLLT
jgi:hypothetical protein